MARASKIIIILTLRLERSWLEPQRFLLFSGSSIILYPIIISFEARAFMARASKIIIILTLRLEQSWLEPQRFL